MIAAASEKKATAGRSTGLASSNSKVFHPFSDSPRHVPQPGHMHWEVHAFMDSVTDDCTPGPLVRGKIVAFRCCCVLQRCGAQELESGFNLDKEQIDRGPSYQRV